MAEKENETQGKKTFEEFLKKRVSASGFPLEIEISGLLDNEYIVHNSYYYFDKEAEIGRSIDIFAFQVT